MTFSIIQKLQLEGTHRLDAEYYQPEYLKLERNLIETKTYCQWKEIDGKFISGPFGSEFKVENYIITDGKFRYVRGKDVKDFFILENDNVYIPEKDFDRLKKYSLQEGDILISVVGTPGSSAIVNNTIMPAIFSCKSTVFRTTAINTLYLIAYLNCKYGKKLLERKIRGALQTGLNIDDLKLLPIFIPDKKSQNSISDLVYCSEKEINNSIDFYTQAEDLLLDQLGFKDFIVKDDLFSIVSLEEVKIAKRVDAECFSNKYNRIIKRLQTNKVEALKKHFEINRGKNFEYIEGGDISVIQTKQLGKQEINLLTEKHTTQKIIDKEKLTLVLDTDILFASMGVGSLGKANIFYNFEALSKDYTVDSTIKIFRQINGRSKVFPEVLLLFINSWIGQELIYQNIVGTSGIISIYEHYIDNLLIPILPIQIQQKIADLVKKSHEARIKSKKLLKEAKQKVEQMIEKSI